MNEKINIEIKEGDVVEIKTSLNKQIMTIIIKYSQKTLKKWKTFLINIFMKF